MQRNLFSAYVTLFSAYHFPVLLKKNIIFVTESIFYKFYYFPKFPFSAQNVFVLSILQHVIASQSNHINTMLPNEMVLAPQQKLKIKYELSYQWKMTSRTRKMTSRTRKTSYVAFQMLRFEKVR
jgi:hypothetical protein